MKRMRKLLLTLFLTLFLIGIFPIAWKWGIGWYYGRSIYTPPDTPEHEVAIVFGAQVRNGRLSTVLRDRMDAAIDLYHNGSVNKLLVSGAAPSQWYDEPSAMRAYAVRQGVPAEDIYTDYEGWRTYDTCYRAKNNFNVETAVLVTQAFHLPRALFICDGLGITAVGSQADVRAYRGADWYEVRETMASLLALWDVIRGQPPAVA